ncbi:MAG: hypothetical protein A4E74_01541 [Syntrophus sp. PtaB.Bin075]|nr:MAG: hypothetical protein A4E74_01541 [Syntrophus sp. PtaB.Bin075]
MSGPIVDDPICICRACGAIYLRDPGMALSQIDYAEAGDAEAGDFVSTLAAGGYDPSDDPDICPNCGALDSGHGRGGTVPGIEYAEAGEAESGDLISKAI